MKKKRLLTDRLGGIEDDIAQRMGEEIAKEIDAQVMFEMLEAIGWTRVVCKPMVMEKGRDIDDWIKDNIKGNIESRGLTWMFEDSRDATAFILKWA